MIQKPKFWQSFIQSLRVEMPYWIITMLLVGLSVMLDVDWIKVIIVLTMTHVGIGACVVFVMFKQRNYQDSTRVDFRGAITNICGAALWPWFVWKRFF